MMPLVPAAIEATDLRKTFGGSVQGLAGVTSHQLVFVNFQDLYYKPKT